ncbi:metallophosphoesterase [Maribellus comscasis]|nr:metallophosphoesterase [Maribellus comscasis]
MYDIIGDVHGQASILKKLLLEIGYQKSGTGYVHPERKAVFVGDFINRGPEIKKTIRIIRSMVENGNALAVLGNHEINAIIYYLKFKTGDPLVKSSNKNFFALFKTISQFSGNADEFLDHLKWMRTLPLYLDMGDFRVVHACWSQPAIDFVKENIPAGKIKKSVFREIYRNSKSGIGKHIWTLSKGVDFTLPGDLKIISNKGVSPRTFRMRWWEKPQGKTFEEMSFESKFSLPDYTIPQQIIPENYVYPEDAPIVFFGHYCRGRGPHIVKSNICCVDSCVNGTKKLTAYRWNGEKTLNKENLVQVGR